LYNYISLKGAHGSNQSNAPIMVKYTNQHNIIRVIYVVILSVVIIKK